MMALVACSAVQLGAAKTKRRAPTLSQEPLELTAFEKTMDGKVMPTGVVPDTILNPYGPSSKLVTLKRNVNVRVPAMANREEASTISVSFGRYDTFNEIMERVSEQLGVEEDDAQWKLVSVETGQVLLERDLGWLKDGAEVILAVPDAAESEHVSSGRTVAVFKNGEVTGAVNYRITPHDTCESIIQATGPSVGVDAVHMADSPSLFDEGGLRLTDSDLGWLQDGARLWVVPAHR